MRIIGGSLCILFLTCCSTAPVNTVNAPVQDGAIMDSSSNSSGASASDGFSSSSPDDSLAEESIELNDAGEALSVDWQEPQTVDTIAFLRRTGSYDRLHSWVTDVWKDPQYVPDVSDEALEHTFTIAQIGIIASGAYQENPLFLVVARSIEEGPFMPLHFRMIETADHSLVMLKQYSDEEYAGYLEGMEPQNASVFHWAVSNASITDLYPPEILSIPDSAVSLVRVDRSFETFSDLQRTFAFNATEGNWDVYFDTVRGCLIVRNRDGTTSFYMLDLSIGASEKGENYVHDSISGRSLSIQWNDGTENIHSYSHMLFSCAQPWACAAVADVRDGNVFETFDRFYDPEKSEQSPPYIATVGHPLEVVGRTADGLNVYREVYTEEDFHDDPIDCKQMTRYLEYIVCEQSVYASEGERRGPSVKEMYNDRAVIYLQDPFGRYLRFRDERFAPPVECGKPVIYLYPEEEMNVRVRVKPSGGFSITEPPYGDDGWHVRATPDGSITELSTGDPYPYLFWEGKAFDYALPKEGFVVARENVEDFLRIALAHQSLNDREIADFLEFWAPRMQAKPYYVVTFLPQEDFDRIAPLTIDPKPDTIIRIFMDYRGLDAPIAIKPPVLRGQDRIGFTVVEWGGAVHY